jgi:adenosylhomocysteine nucleosidase
LSVTGVVTALDVEARTLGRLTRGVRLTLGEVQLATLSDGTLVAVSGMGAAAAASGAQALVNGGATALVSWGTAGGLDPTLRAGTLCVPSSVMALDGVEWPTDPHWREILCAAIAARQPLSLRKLLTHPTALADVAGKAAAFRDTGAVAVDMESVAIAAVAARNRVPFVAVRVIVDTALDALPGAVIAATRGGRVRTASLLRELVMAPGDLGGLLRLASRYTVAKRALATVARTGALAPLAFGAGTARRIL